MAGGRRAKPTGRYRSKLEARFGDYLAKLGWSFLYEPLKIPYIVPAKNRTYNPDFIIDRNNKRRITKQLSFKELRDNENYIVLETKGRLTLSDRNKTEYVLDHNPWLRDRYIMVFPRDNYISSRKSKKNPGSGMKYSDWCEKNGVRYYIGEEVPQSMLKGKN